MRWLEPGTRRPKPETWLKVLNVWWVEGAKRRSVAPCGVSKTIWVVNVEATVNVNAIRYV